MANPKYCPILLIGFEAPKGNNTFDPRVCHSDCAWYDKMNKQCILHSINQSLENIENYQYVGIENYYEEDYTGIKEEEYETLGTR